METFTDEETFSSFLMSPYECTLMEVNFLIGFLDRTNVKASSWKTAFLNCS